MEKENQYFHVVLEGKLSESETRMLKDAGAVISGSNSLIGGSTITDILIILSTPIVLKSIKEVVLGIVASKRRVTINMKGIKVTDVDQKTALEIIERIAGQD